MPHSMSILIGLFTLPFVGEGDDVLQIPPKDQIEQ